jgi:uncharacterized protein
MDTKKSGKRDLGDEWLGWQGGSDKNDDNTEEGKRLFLLFSSFSLAIFLLVAIFLLYLISPRLVQISPLLSKIAWTLLGITALLSTVWFFLMLRSAITEKHSLSSFFGKGISINFFIPLATKLGTRFGISKDRIWNSFIKVSNSLTRSAGKKTACERLLVLIPRCLSPSIKKETLDLGKKYRCKISVVPGGTEARRLIQNLRPEAIIAVACERDLLTGIQDLASKIPILGIPNQRPKGPCKDCTVDFGQIKDALEFFVGKK